jgi:chromosome partitioning protein
VNDERVSDRTGLAGGQHSPGPSGRGKGTWLHGFGLQPADLAGSIIAVAAYKGGVGKTLLAYELAYLLGGILVDLDWDRGNASVSWGYRDEQRSKSPLLDALDRGRTPRPLAGGRWRPDLVPCSKRFGTDQPCAEDLTTALQSWAAQWAAELRCPLIIDTHPGTQSSTFGAVAAAHVVVVPVVLGEREMSATEDMVDELKGHPLLLVPNKVTMNPPTRYTAWLEHVADRAMVPIGPAISDNAWLTTRRRRMAVTAGDSTPVRARTVVYELHRVARTVVNHARVALSGRTDWELSQELHHLRTPRVPPPARASPPR